MKIKAEEIQNDWNKCQNMCQSIEFNNPTQTVLEYVVVGAEDIFWNCFETVIMFNSNNAVDLFICNPLHYSTFFKKKCTCVERKTTLRDI